MENDDEPTGRLLTRREMLKLLAALGAAAAAGCASGLGNPGGATSSPATTNSPAASPPAGTAPAITPPTEPISAAPTSLPACVVRPEQTEGPFFVDEVLNRTDIRGEPSDGSTRPGVPLALAFLVSRIGTVCEPLPDAIVYVWHCDADGIYSGVNDVNAGSTAGLQFLRGYQVTDAGGRAAFTTIYPGWYPGRTVHIHFKIRAEASGRNYEFTSQLYFDDALTDQVFTQAPYAERGPRNTRNPDDGIYRRGGDQLTLQVLPAAEGYAATFDIGLQFG